MLPLPLQLLAEGDNLSKSIFAGIGGVEECGGVEERGNKERWGDLCGNVRSLTSTLDGEDLVSTPNLLGEDLVSTVILLGEDLVSTATLFSKGRLTMALGLLARKGRGPALTGEQTGVFRGCC